MSGYGPRRTFSNASAGGGGAAPGSRGTVSRGHRNTAAMEAQRRLVKMMTGTQEDESDEDEHYQPPIAQPAPLSRQARPAQLQVAGSRRGMATPIAQGPLSPESATGSQTYHSYGEHRMGGGGGGSRRYGAEDQGSSREAELRHEVSKLRDDIDLLSEENDILMDKLNQAQEDLKKSTTRCHELEKQIANLGGGISMEARLLAKKEAALKQREAALKAATEQNRDLTQVEINNLKMEAEAAKAEAHAATDMAQQAEDELRQLRAMTSRLILSPEEKEEVVLKRCWLARYWLLAKHHGVHPEVAGPHADLWQGLAPIPMEVVVAAGQKAKDDHRWNQGFENGLAEGKGLNLKDLNSDINIESMFQVEKGMRDLASLKVEEGVVLAMAQHRRPSLIRVGANAEPGANPGEGPRLQESMDLSEEEVEDVQFKQYWMVYFWRRAKTASVEADLADERLQYWIARTNYQAKAHDAVDAERGLLEVRKLGLEQQLWEASRARAAADSNATSSSQRTMSPGSSTSHQHHLDGGSPSI